MDLMKIMKNENANIQNKIGRPRGKNSLNIFNVNFSYYSVKGHVFYAITLLSNVYNLDKKFLLTYISSLILNFF